MMLAVKNSLFALLLVASASATAAPAGATESLTEATVKSVIEKSMPRAKFTWRSVEIAAPRAASAGESRASGLPANQVIYPVRVDYTWGVGDGARDTKWNYFFYKDDFGTWAKQSNATTGNLESDLYSTRSK